MEEPQPEVNEPLNRLLAETVEHPDEPYPEQPYYESIGIAGPYFAVIKVKLALNGTDGESPFPEKDIPLMQYASLNIIQELLDRELDARVFYAPDRSINILAQWSEEAYEEQHANRISQLEMIGRSMHHHIGKYLKMECTVGISQILKGLQFVHVLSRQADKAMLWAREHGDYHVFITAISAGITMPATRTPTSFPPRATASWSRPKPTSKTTTAKKGSRSKRSQGATMSARTI